MTATPDPEEGGTVEGAGVFYYGTTCTLTATPSEGYLFLNWSNKDGKVISCNASYSFTVTENIELEAIFMPLEGILIGEGEATNMYLPSCSSNSYTLSQQIYTPDEIGASGNINAVSYFNTGETKIRNYDIYMVHTDKSTFDSITDWITVTEADLVYSGSVTMAKGYWTSIVLDTLFHYDGTSNLAIIVDDNTGSESSGMSCRVFNTEGNQAIRVFSNSTNYNPMEPPTAYGLGEYSSLESVKNQIMFNITPSTVEQTYTLAAGCNWWSTNVNITLDDLKAALLKALPNANSITIKSQGYGQTTWNGRFWSGQLWTLNVTRMFKINVPADCELTLTGTPINPAEHPVTINEGTNWIGYPLRESMAVTDAFADFAANNDIVKSVAFGQANWNGRRWMGTLKNLMLGKGYIYKSSVMGSRTFTFPTSAK